VHQFENTNFAHPETLQPLSIRRYENALDASLRDWSREAAQHILRTARQRLRDCEEAFTEYLGEDRPHLIENISAAERQVAEAKARLRSLGIKVGQ